MKFRENQKTTNTPIGQWGKFMKLREEAGHLNNLSRILKKEGIRYGAK